MAIPDPTKFKLTTRYNIQKIFANGSVDVSLIGFTEGEYTIFVHGLGYIPTVRVFYIPVSGQLWPVTREQYSSPGGGSGSILNYLGEPVITTNELKVRMVNNAATANVTFYYRIYIDE